MSAFIDIIKDTDKPIVLVDLSWVLYKSNFIFTEDKFKTSKGEPNGHLLGFTNLLKTCYKLGYMTFICEDGHCAFRRELNENYKANRNSKSFIKDTEIIENLVNDLPNTYCVKNENYEADDLLYTLASLAWINKKEVYIHTADKDLYQALGENIHIASKITLKQIDLIDENSEQYTKNFPVPPEKLPIYRAFKGDVSDNLPAVVPGIRKELLLQLVDYIAEHGNIKDFKVEKKSHEKYIKSLIENWNTFKTNYEIMKLNMVHFDLVEKVQEHKSIIEAHKFELFGYEEFLRNILIYKGE